MVFTAHRVITVVSDRAAFKHASEMIIANRNSLILDNMAANVYTRNLFGKD